MVARAEALAERARMSTEGVSALKRGYRRTPQRETLALLAEALALDGERQARDGARRERNARATASARRAHGDGWRREDADGVAGRERFGRYDGRCGLLRRARTDRRSVLWGLRDASALGIRPAPDQPPLQMLLAYLKSKALLLILDNCEQRHYRGGCLLAGRGDT